MNKKYTNKMRTMAKHIAFMVAMVLLASPVWSLDLDLEHSSLDWKATKKLGSGHSGSINFKSAQIKADAKGNVLGGEFVVDMNTLKPTDLKEKPKEEADLTNHLKSEDFFNVNKFPISKLVISEVKGNTAKGDLTIRDKTNPIGIDFKVNGKVYEGTFKFDRTKFDVKYNSTNFFKKLADEKIINNEIEVTFKVTLK